LPDCAALAKPLFSPLWIRKNRYKFALALARGEASLRILDFFERQRGMKFRRRTQQTDRTGKQEQRAGNQVESGKKKQKTKDKSGCQMSDVWKR